VTTVGHSQAAQYPRSIAAPDEGVRPLVKAVAALHVRAGPAPHDVRLHHDNRLPRLGSGGSSRQPGQPRPDHHNRSLITFSHAHMTPPLTLL
jgi:hypothetical protein